MSEKLYQVLIKSQGETMVYGHMYGERDTKDWVRSLKERFPWFEDIWYKEL